MGLRLALALVEGVVIKIKTLPYNSRPRCYFRARGTRRKMAGVELITATIAIIITTTIELTSLSELWK